MCKYTVKKQDGEFIITAAMADEYHAAHIIHTYRCGYIDAITAKKAFKALYLTLKTDTQWKALRDAALTINLFI